MFFLNQGGAFECSDAVLTSALAIKVLNWCLWDAKCCYDDPRCIHGHCNVWTWFLWSGLWSWETWMICWTWCLFLCLYHWNVKFVLFFDLVTHLSGYLAGKNVNVSEFDGPVLKDFLKGSMLLRYCSVTAFIWSEVPQRLLSSYICCRRPKKILWDSFVLSFAGDPRCSVLGGNFHQLLHFSCGSCADASSLCWLELSVHGNKKG